MQFMPDTARRYGLRDPHDARAAIDAAAHYLRDLLVRFDGRLDLALAAYNAGEGTVDSFLTGRPLRLAGGKVINPSGLVTGGIPPYRETRAYVDSAIALFLSRPARWLKPHLPVSTNTKGRRSSTRNFSFDVSANSKAQPVRDKTDTGTFFIEVP